MAHGSGEVVGFQRHFEHADGLVEATDRLLDGERLRDLYLVERTGSTDSRSQEQSRRLDLDSEEVCGTLTIPNLIGERSHQGAPHDAVWELIVNLQDWGRVLAPLTDPARREGGKNFGTARKYAMSGLLSCALCGATLTSMTASRLRGHSFVCSKIPYNGCGKVRISHQPLEDYTREQVFARLDTSRLDPPVDDSAREAEKTLHSELDKLGQQLARVKEGYIEGILSARDVKVEQARIEKARDAAEKALADVAAQHVTANIPRGDRLRELWTQRDASWQRQVLNSVIETVKVKPHPKGVTTNLTGAKLRRRTSSTVASERTSSTCWRRESRSSGAPSVTRFEGYYVGSGTRSVGRPRTHSFISSVYICCSSTLRFSNGISPSLA